LLIVIIVGLVCGVLYLGRGIFEAQQLNKQLNGLNSRLIETNRQLNLGNQSLSGYNTQLIGYLNESKRVIATFQGRLKEASGILAGAVHR
jgi:predicted PurR-regulated permease PerM